MVCFFIVSCREDYEKGCLVFGDCFIVVAGSS